GRARSTPVNTRVRTAHHSARRRCWLGTYLLTPLILVGGCARQHHHEDGAAGKGKGSPTPSTWSIWVDTASFSPDGRRLAVAYRFGHLVNAPVRIWDTEKRQVLWTLS